MEWKNIVNDFFKSIDTAKEDIESLIEKNKTKQYDTFPALKEIEKYFHLKLKKWNLLLKRLLITQKTLLVEQKIQM